MKNTLVVSAILAALGASSFAHASDVVVNGYGSAFPTVGLESPSTITWNFSAPAGATIISFDVLGFNTLDGFSAGAYSDWFSLKVNGQSAFTGTFDLGGGGGTPFYFANDGSTVNSTSNGFNAGGVAHLSVPITLGSGTQKIVFAYSSPIPQGTGDESWTIAHVQVASVPEPESYAMLLAGLGLMGGIARRRKANQA